MAVASLQNQVSDILHCVNPVNESMHLRKQCTIRRFIQLSIQLHKLTLNPSAFFLLIQWTECKAPKS